MRIDSGWIINLKNGYRVILSESTYEEYQTKTPKEDVQSEEHWFSLQKAIEKNPELDFID